MRTLGSAALLARMAEKGMTIISLKDIRCERCGAPVPAAQWKAHRDACPEAGPPPPR